jgi:cytidine deaminase
VVYIEPYQKSKAAEFHSDSIALGFDADSTKVVFEPFVGVGPRRFFDLFSLTLGSGAKLVRKDEDRLHRADWSRDAERSVRISMSPGSYLEAEAAAVSGFRSLKEGVGKDG